mgnify:CR=1 FL=1
MLVGLLKKVFSFMVTKNNLPILIRIFSYSILAITFVFLTFSTLLAEEEPANIWEENQVNFIQKMRGIG